MINLYPHQEEIVQLNIPKWGLWFRTGVGKTITAIALAEKNLKSCLVICPKMLKPMWSREINKHSSACNYTIITKEEFRAQTTILPRYEGIIADEGHYFAGEKSQLSKRLMWYTKKHDIKYLWMCTATPMLSTPMSVYVLAKQMGHDWNYWGFRKKFYYEVRMGHRMIMKPRACMESELVSLLKKIGSVVDLDTAVEKSEQSVHNLPKLSKVPEQTFETEYFELTDEQKKAIAELSEPQFITRWTKTSCIENGLLYSDGYNEDQTFPCKKTDRIIELCEENDKIAVFCRYNKQIDYLNNLLTGSGKMVYLIRGDVKDRDSVVSAVDKDEKCIVLIQSDTAEGYELPSIRTIVFASLSFSYKNLTQGIGRFLRINKMAPNRYIYLVSNGVDKEVYDCLMRKEDFYIELHAK